MLTKKSLLLLNSSCLSIKSLASSLSTTTKNSFYAANNNSTILSRNPSTKVSENQPKKNLTSSATKFTMNPSLQQNKAKKVLNLKSALSSHNIQLNGIFFDEDSTPNEYAKLNHQWQTRRGKIYPLAYLVPRSVVEIQKAIICGKQLGIRTTPKSGGHGFTKYAFGDENTLVIDLRKLNSVQVDQTGHIATIGAGARNGKLAYDLWEQGQFTAPIGDCPAVGIGGYALGGGKGTLNRHYGLMLENITEMEMVDSNGDLLVTNEHTNPDLFWALRGAGSSGSFGIVTSIKIKVFKAPLLIRTYTFQYDFNTQFPQVFAALQKYATSDIKTSGQLKYGKDLILTLRFDEIFYSKRDSDEYKQENGDYSKLIQSFPPTMHNGEVKVSEAVNYPTWIMEKGLATYGDYVKPNVQITKPSDLALVEDGIGEAYHKRRSILASRALNDKEIDALFKLYQEVIPDVTGWIEAYGGKINEIGSTETSFVHRNALYLICVRYESALEDPNWLTKANYFIEKAKAIIGNNSTATYQNYVDDDLQNYLHEYYGQNLQRLVQIKRKYDPEDFFNTPQSIPLTL